MRHPVLRLRHPSRSNVRHRLKFLLGFVPSVPHFRPAFPSHHKDERKRAEQFGESSKDKSAVR